MKYVMQKNHYDCGVACVCSILKHYNIFYDEVHVRDLCKCSHKGVTGLGILKALEAYLVEVEAFKVESLNLIKDYPVIALIDSEIGHHYVMITKYSKGIVYYHDPLNGILKKSVCEFNKLFLGIIFTCKPTFKVNRINNRAAVKHRYNPKQLLVMMVLAFLIFIAMLLSNYQLKTILDASDLTVENAVIYILIFETVRVMLGFLKNTYIASKVKKTKNEVSKSFITNFINLDYTYFHRRTSADFDLIYSDSKSLSHLTEIYSTIYFHVILQVLYVLMILMIEPKIAFIQVIVSLLLLIYLYRFSSVIRSIQSIMFQSNLLLKNKFLSLVKGFQEIRVNNIASKAKDGYQDIHNRNSALEFKSQKTIYFYSSILDLLLVFNYVLTLSILVNLLLDGLLSKGEFVLLITMFINFNQTFNIYPLSIFNIQNMRLAKARSNNLHLYSNYKIESLEENIRSITFKDVTYSYEYGKQLISNLSFELETKNLYFFTGDNGVGKSTITKLIIGFLTPDDGKILINNKKKTAKVTLISDDSILFNDSVLNNITLSSKIDNNKIETIKQKFNISDSFLKQEIYNFGKNLSSGQQQTVLLARSVYQNDQCIIFDEPFTYLAPDLKNKFLSVIRELSRNKLIIIVTHDRSIINKDDKIINLKENEYEKINF